MRAEQVAQHLARHAGRGPRRDVAGRDDAGVGEAGFRGDAAAALEDGDLVAVGGQFVGGGDADDAGADDGDAHRVRPARGRAASIASDASVNARAAQGRILTLRGQAPQVAGSLDWLESTARGVGAPEYAVIGLAAAALARAAAGRKQSRDGAARRGSRDAGAREIQYYGI